MFRSVSVVGFRLHVRRSHADDWCRQRYKRVTRSGPQSQVFMNTKLGFELCDPKWAIPYFKRHHDFSSEKDKLEQGCNESGISRVSSESGVSRVAGLEVKSESDTVELS